MKAIWNNLLKITAFRRAILAHLNADFFHEFKHSIPLGNDYWAYLWENDAYDSFSEIFIQQEYSDLIPDESILLSFFLTEPAENLSISKGEAEAN